MDKNRGIIIVVIMSILLLCGFILIRKNFGNIKEISFSNIEVSLKDDDYSIVYLGELTKDKKSLLKDAVKGTRISLYKTSASIYELNNFLKSNNLSTTNNDGYLIFLNDEVEAYIDGNVDNDRFLELVRWYFFNEIPESEIAYKTIGSADDYFDIIDSEKYTVTVFGRKSCTYCNLYLPKVNEVARDYNVDIIYFDKDTYNEDEYEEVMKIGLEIPAKCTSDNNATSTLGEFAKPMTLIVKNGKTVDCIKGNVPKETLVEMLKKYKIIKEKK